MLTQSSLREENIFFQVLHVSYYKQRPSEKPGAGKVQLVLHLREMKLCIFGIDLVKSP